MADEFEEEDDKESYIQEINHFQLTDPKLKANQ